MKGSIQIVVLILTSTLFFLSFKVSSLSAQGCAELCSPQGNCGWGYHCNQYGICVNNLTCPSCTGDTGKHGACQQIQDCPSGWDDGFGDCVSVPYQIYECCAEPTPVPTRFPPHTCGCIPTGFPPCQVAWNSYCQVFENPVCDIDQFGQCQETCTCVPNTPTPTSPPSTPRPTPKLGCGDQCQDSSECDQFIPLDCDPNYKLCESPIACPICTGTISGDPGVCLDPDVCEGLGKNPNDGVGTCAGGVADVCCTNYVNVPNCQLFPIPPFYMLIAFTVNITSPLPNITYVTSGGPRCVCFSPTFNDPYHGSFTCTCSPTGLYTISAHSLNNTITCSVDVNVSQPNPYPTCTGHFTKQPGECHYLDCPLATYFDGMNPPFSDTGCAYGDACCVYDTNGQIIRPPLIIGCVRDGNLGINTAIGCIPINSQTSFLTFILPWAVGVGGGTAFILIIIGGFLFMTSGGDPRKAKAAKELLTSAIAGLLMIIFSVYILDLIGIRILNIPGL